MRFRRPASRLALPCLLAIAAASAQARAQVHRCTMPDGTAVYTDRSCAALGASEQPPRTGLGAGGIRLYRGGCSRNLQDLVYEITTAIDAGDVNRLAGAYHWVGVSSGSAVALMDRLGAVVRRPLVDIVPVAAQAPDDATGSDLYPQTTVRRPPVALRVEQTLANGSTPSRTIFGLRRHLDCWWITL